MIRLLRKVREKLFSENKISKYFLYSIGEITLVVIGILIAVQLNNLNEGRKLKVVETNILEGIRSDILKDTVDLNYNIRGYQQAIKRDSLILQHLLGKYDHSRRFVEFLHAAVLEDFLILLHKSHFEEAKNRGLSIISNNDLREAISRLYEFDYELLIYAENSSRQLDHSKILGSEFMGYFGLDASKVSISKQQYNNLLNDTHTHYVLNRAIRMRQILLDYNQATLEKALSVKDRIDEELASLKAE